MKTLYIIANWKMNPTSLKEAEKLAGDVVVGMKKLGVVSRRGGRQVGAKGRIAALGLGVVLCPPFPYLGAVANKLMKLKANEVNLGAQNIYFEDKGAYTGEVSPSMLKDLGCKFVIVGHSERRKYFKESGELINKKIKAVLKNNMRPVLAIGESNSANEDANAIIANQLISALKDINAAQVKNILIAYEPVWAIGTGQAAQPDYIMSMRLYIQKILASLYLKNVAKSIPILYGGSIDRKNISSFIKDAEMDGALVGASSLDAKEFLAMIKKLAKIV